MGSLNASGVTRLVTKLKDRFSAIVHSHSAGDITSGTLAVARGGTGAGTASGARTNLDAAQSDGASGTLKSAEDAIDNLEASIAPVESVTATSNHAVGDYFMLGNVLMKATSAIATGETITTSNATPATVQGQIDTFRDSVSLQDITPTYTAASGVTVKQFKAFKYGKVVYVVIYFSLSVAMSNNSALITANANFPRPAWYNAQAVVTDVTGIKGTLSILYTSTRNIIQCNGPLSTGDYLVAQFCYVATDE